jgi:hypothetical protein
MNRVAQFPPGRLLATPAALRACERAHVVPWAYLQQHLTGDWGVVDAEDKAANDRALRDGDRLLSAYVLPTGVRIWIITEWDRSATTILLPSDY